MGVAESRVLAGVQILFGYFSVGLHGPGPVAQPRVAQQPWSGNQPSVLSRMDVSFAVRPPKIGNEIWVVFRGTRDPSTGSLVGEIVPDGQMRVIGAVPTVMFTVGSALLTGAIVAMLGGGEPQFFMAIWSSFVVLFGVMWARSCGAAVHEAALNIQRDSPVAQLVWHPGLRTGSRPAAPPPPTGSEVTAPRTWMGRATAGWAGGEPAVPSRASAWLGLRGLAVPIAVVVLVLLPMVRSRAESADWVRVTGIAGAEVDLDHRRVAYVLPDGTEKVSTVPVMRTVEAGQVIDLYYPPGRPDLIEQDRSGFVLPYVVFGGFAVLSTILVLGHFIFDLRRSRPRSSA